MWYLVKAALENENKYQILQIEHMNNSVKVLAGIFNEIKATEKVQTMFQEILK